MQFSSGTDSSLVLGPNDLAIFGGSMHWKSAFGRLEPSSLDFEAFR
jgi:hypothetical protein